MADLLMDEEGELSRYVNQNTQRDMTVTRNVMRNVTVGALVSTWGVLRHRGKRQLDDLTLKGCTLSIIDDVSEIPGFGEAMKFVGWVVETDEGIVLPNFFEEFNVDPEEDSRKKNAERQRRYREKQASKNNANGNVTVTSESNVREEKRRDSKQTILDASQATPTETESSKDSNPRGSRLPDDWQLSKALGDWALKERPTWTPEHVRLEAEKFADYWHGRPGAAGRKSDWAATWRNWIRNANGTPAMPASATPRLAAI